MVMVGISGQPLPLACGGVPGHRGMVWMPRNALSVPATPQSVVWACRLRQVSSPPTTASAVIRENNEVMDPPGEFESDYSETLPKTRKTRPGTIGNRTELPPYLRVQCLPGVHPAR